MGKPTFETRTLTERDAEQVQTAQAGVPTDAIVVRPHQDNAGIDGMDDVLTSLPRAETESAGLLRGTQTTAAPFAFELRYADDGTGERVLTLQYVTRDERLHALLGRHLPDKYPDSLVETRPATWLSVHQDQHMAAATLGLRRYTLYPLKNAKLDSFRRDPTGSIITEMVGAAEASGADADVAVQVLARPAGTDWQQGVPGGYGLADRYGEGLTASETRVTNPLSTQKLRHLLTQPTYECRAILPTPIGTLLGALHPFFRDEFTHEPSKADRQAATMLSDLDGRGWECHVRLVAVSDDAALATERVASTAAMFDNYYEYRGAQTFLPIPKRGSKIVETATAAAAREWPTNPAQRIIKPQIELAGLVNVPRAEDVATNKLRWALAAPGDGIPPGTARFDGEAHGVTADANSAALQVAMLDAAGPEEPLWYGTGVKHGTEAGVFPETLYHQFVGGSTRMGKTTLLSNFTAQCYRGDGGGLVLDPKGLDAEAFLAEWPRDRPVEDLVVMDLADGFDEIPRFNFLEIPDYLDPGTRAHTSYVEALAEDILAMVAEAGGSDKYMGALMKRVVKTVVRGLARSGETATLLDVAAVCASSENLSRFRERMAAERFAFLRETAERLEARDDTDLEPLAGRMDEWVLNDNVRELICAREASFSINDVVREGRFMVVRFAPASSATEIQMVGTALIRRTYFAQRHLQPGHPFDLVCDEFDTIASEESNIQSILSEAAAFGYRCTLACQAPTNQLPERVRRAIENQCGTFLSFNPGGGRDAKWISHQHTVDAEDLLNLPRYRFYMRATTRDDDLTHSYMVEGFPPAREVRGDGRTDREIRALTEASLAHYGAPTETEAEQRAASPFIGDGTEPRSETETDGLEMTEQRERTAVQAVYDVAIRAGDPDAFVGLSAVHDTLCRRLAALEGVVGIETRLETKGDCWRAVLQHVRDVWLETRTREGETQVRARNPRQVICHIGSNRSAGGAAHALLLWAAYAPLTRAGFDVTISDASGTDPDGLATPIDDPADPDLVNRLLGEFDEARIESESSTVSKPGSTVRHILQAHAEGRATIVCCRPDDADAVREVIDTDPPLCRSGHDVSGEIRYYTSPRDLRIDGEPMGRPGGRENVWIREASGEVVLRDEMGTEHARFDSMEAVFEDAEAYPGGEQVVKRPVMPERVLAGKEPTTTIVVIPESTETLNELSIDGMSYPTHQSGVVSGGVPIPEHTEPLADLLTAGESISKPAAKARLAEHGHDVSRATVHRWMTALEDVGVLHATDETTETGATVFHIDTGVSHHPETAAR